MPELPEVEVIVQELRKKLIGEEISIIKANWHKTVVRTDYSPEGETINAVKRHGKYIIVETDNGAILVHLRMTGQLIIDTNTDESQKHVRAIIFLKSGKTLYFYDSRKFGRIYLTQSPQTVLRNVGLDALSKEFTLQTFSNLLAGKSTKIKSFLLDQKYLAGLGNIYIDESLFSARIHPLSPCRCLTKQDIKRLYPAINKILTHAIENMGTTISDYKTVGGGFGEYQNFLKVYGRTDMPCVRCGHSIQKIKVNNRGTHFCPQCQHDLQ